MQMFYPKTDSNQQANMNWIYTKIKLPTAQDADINGNVLGCFGLLNQITYVRLIQWNFICHKLGYYAWCSVPTTATLETTELEKDQLEIAKIVFAFAQQTPTTDTAQTLHRKLLVRGRELGTKISR